MSSSFLAPAVGLIYLGSMALFWWTLKRMARLLDRPLLWDAADGVVGLATGAFAFPLTLPLVQIRPELAISTSPQMLALRNSAALALGMTIFFVILSMAIEKQYDVDVPDSLRPLEDRFWDHQLGWVPWSPEEGYRGPRLRSVPGVRRLAQ